MTFATVVMALLVGLPSAAGLDHPNIVLIVADDLGWGDVGYHGGRIRTPHIDRLAARGVALERFYVYPMCHPTRTALMTGRSTIEIQAQSREARRGPGTLPLDERLLPEYLREAGYQTFMGGKWHLGRSHVNYFPHHRGFDQFYGLLNAYTDYFTHIANGGLDWQRNDVSVREEGYTTDLLTDEAVRRLRQRDPNRPVLLYVAYNAVHLPLEAPGDALEEYASIENERFRTYAAMTTRMDAGIGRIIAELEKQKMGRDTLVLFFSDNGPAPVGDPSPLRGRKGTAYEGGLRVPAILWWPGVIEGGGSSDQILTVHDLLPTLAAAAGVSLDPPKPLYGQNLWDAVRTGRIAPHDDFVIGYRGNFAVYRQEWKLVRSREPGAGGRPTRLFRIHEDPNEQNDLAADHSKLVEELAAMITALAGDVEFPTAGRRPAGARPRGDVQFVPQLEETREPWAEAAARN